MFGFKAVVISPQAVVIKNKISIKRAIYIENTKEALQLVCCNVHIHLQKKRQYCPLKFL